MEDKEKFEEFEEDFDVNPAQYEVWMLGYDKDQNITDYAHILNRYSDPDIAIKFAQSVCLDIYPHIPLKTKEAVTYVEVLVETVVDVEGTATNVGTLFSEILKIK